MARMRNVLLRHRPRGVKASGRSELTGPLALSEEGPIAHARPLSRPYQDAPLPSDNRTEAMLSNHGGPLCLNL
jgi:hypothetical protein